MFGHVSFVEYIDDECVNHLLLQKAERVLKASSDAVVVVAYLLIGSVIMRKIVATEAMKMLTLAVSFIA